MSPLESQVVAQEQHYELRIRGPSIAESANDGGTAEVSQPGSAAGTSLWKIAACAYSFFISGVNDGVLGPLLPYILRSFDLSTGELAFLYLCTFLGWLTAMPLNPLLAKYLPLGATLSIGAMLQLVAQLMRPWGPLPLFAVSFYVVALGMALQDSHSNTFVSTVNLAHRWLGVIHGSYAAGLVVAPLIATSLASQNDHNIVGLQAWRATYFVLIGLDALNLAAVVIAFLPSTQWRPSTTPRADGGSAMQDLKASLLSGPLWLLSASFCLQLGAMMTAGGWVVEYLVTIRGGDLSAVGYVPTGFNAGTLIGRLVLVEPMHRFGEQRTVLASFGVVLILQLLFWLVPNIIGSATALSLMGLFAGPFIPVGISVASRLFPRKIQSAALGIVFVLAQAGGAFFPSLTGVIAQRTDVGVLQPIIVALIACAVIFWFLVPRVPENEGADGGNE